MKTYTITVSDDQTSDFEAGCTQIGLTPDELFTKVVCDAVHAARVAAAEMSVPPVKPANPDGVDVNVS